MMEFRVTDLMIEALAATKRTAEKQGKEKCPPCTKICKSKTAVPSKCKTSSPVSKCAGREEAKALHDALLAELRAALSNGEMPVS
jgi:hypothetical protein